MRDDARVRFRVEHFRAVERTDTALGVGYAPTGQSEDLEAHDEAEAAAVALTAEGEEIEPETVAYDPANRLYAFAGEDEAVRVTPVEAAAAG